MAGTSPGWVYCPSPCPSARLRLFCFPYAGGSGSIFNAWYRHLPPAIEIASAQLPGRDARRHEPPLNDFRTLVSSLADALRWSLDIPFAFFGHSMGAIVGFEVARELRRRGLPMPVHLFVSAHRAPHLGVLNAGERPLHGLPDDAFVRELQRRYGATPDLVRGSELAELFVPLLRADLALCESYVYHPEPRLPCSISAFGGSQDRRVKKAQLDAWRSHTSSAFELRMLPGDHFFVRNDSLLLLRLLKQQLEQIVRRTAVPAS
jgi:medium-chain acyl-[acyl-carrier-protein] hydrolase